MNARQIPARPVPTAISVRESTADEPAGLAEQFREWLCASGNYYLASMLAQPVSVGGRCAGEGTRVARAFQYAVPGRDHMRVAVVAGSDGRVMAT